MLPAFRRLESDLDFADEWHGSDGPIPVRRSRPDAETPLQQAVLGAAAILLRSGIGPAVDLEALGVERSSTATGAVIRITFALLVPRPRGEAAAVTRRVAR